MEKITQLRADYTLCILHEISDMTLVAPPLFIGMWISCTDRFVE